MNHADTLSHLVFTRDIDGAREAIRQHDISVEEIRTSVFDAAVKILRIAVPGCTPGGKKKAITDARYARSLVARNGENNLADLNSTAVNKVILDIYKRATEAGKEVVESVFPKAFGFNKRKVPPITDVQIDGVRFVSGAENDVVMQAFDRLSGVSFEKIKESEIKPQCVVRVNGDDILLHIFAIHAAREELLIQAAEGRARKRWAYIALYLWGTPSEKRRAEMILVEMAGVEPASRDEAR
ncbi:MAG: hypothetical protein AAB592_02035 [Patescibacteria group bacterium]